MKSKLLVILGTTSTGKTDRALQMAQKLNGELVSADSRQVYKYLDIGTGKSPSKFNQLKKENGFWEIDGVKVWMYDVADPKLRFNLYEFILNAQEIIERITKDGKLPILVGGTGFYIRGLLEGISDFGIDENKDLRTELETLDIEEIKNRIGKANSEALNNLNNSEINNKRRLVRLLEKLINPTDQSKSFTGLEKNFDILKIGLKVDKQILNSRIKKRVISRVEEGMIKEAESLLENGTLDFQRMDELGLEYRYLAKLIKGDIKTVGEFIEILSLKISQFAKRQETWFKKEKDVSWFNIQDSDFIVQVEKKVLGWYNNGCSEQQS